MATAKQRSKTSAALAQARFRERKQREEAHRTMELEALRENNKLLARLVQQRSESEVLPSDNITVAVSPGRNGQTNCPERTDISSPFSACTPAAAMISGSESWPESSVVKSIETPYPAVIESAKDDVDGSCGQRDLEQVVQDELSEVQRAWGLDQAGESLPSSYFDLDDVTPNQVQQNCGPSVSVEPAWSVQHLPLLPPTTSSQMQVVQQPNSTQDLSGPLNPWPLQQLPPPHLAPSVPLAASPPIWSQPSPAAVNPEAGIFAVQYMLDLIQQQLRNERLISRQSFTSF